jgi:hypothetical protein
VGGKTPGGTAELAPLSLSPPSRVKGPTDGKKLGRC